MFGQIEILQGAVVFLSLIAIVTDLVWGRIFNALTFPAMFLGMSYSIYFIGWSGLGQSLLGLAAGFLFFGWMFAFRVMGGGDVKLLMALGAWGGFHYTAEVAVLSVLVGGGVALLTLIVTGRIFSFTQRMYTFFLSVFVKELEVTPPKLDRKLTMPFGVSMAIAAIWTVYLHPLSRLGVFS